MSDFFQTMLVAGTNPAWLIAAVGLLGCLGLGYQLARISQRYRDARDEQKNHQELIDNLSEGIYRSSLDGRQLSANPALVRLNGYESEAALLAGVKDIAKEWYVGPTRRDAFRAELEANGKVENFVSEVYRHKTRERIWVSESARLVRDRRTGKPLYYEGSVREITETVKRLKLQDMFEKLTSQLPGGLFQLLRRDNGEFSILYVSKGLRDLLGYDDRTVPDDPNTVLHVIHNDDRAHYLETLRDSGIKLKPWECEFRIHAMDGVEKWLRVAAMPETTKEGIVWHGYLSDISLRKKNEMEIERLAFYDPLTRLPNRRRLFDEVGRQMASCQKSGQRGALLFIDLDNFKTLNDTMGHDVGDVFLKQVADRLQAAVAPQDSVGRIGGDEFVIVLCLNDTTAATATRNAIVAANRVLAALRQEFVLGHMIHHTSASVGVLVFDGSEKGPEVLMKNADMAMYQAKSLGRNNVALFDPKVLRKERKRFRLLNDMRSALVDNNLELHYQPQVNAAGHVVGAEALLRWNHAEHGALSPSDFVGLAEQHGLAELLGRGVIDTSVRTLAQWKDNPRLAGLRMAVNLSLKSLRDPDFLDFLHDRLNTHGLDPQRLTLEMTERVLTSDQMQITRRMHELKALGVRLSLDDFGTGYSSIANLKKLPFDELKIDGSFIADITSSESNRALVQTMLDMASTLGLSAVAEHVQTQQQEVLLKSSGCEYFQGWLYGRAMTGRDFANYVLERNPASILKFPNSRQGA
ncbi:putative bifunctional diguanylate cyclase/phosphodiesterase [Nitratireductor kimnyeongensis]|uniref:Bifunctional diguanylate cyclase/phosphodiesterase n=1 Tax=Nitratireductor kimnyeongensis TaxID=430679 RepID=A0ABW0T3A0_9HYPH|nr:GGDEF domain-containing phosphodiesterase [Nitratireductor kimnyeongensis]QZZ35131.1 EAL domain-containing protein [Nitratireductor kimnyeongensis]